MDNTHLQKLINDIEENSPTVDLFVTDHETGKDTYIKSGPHLQLHAEVTERVKSGQDAWVRLPITRGANGQ